jgi:hypothetical protein
MKIFRKFIFIFLFILIPLISNAAVSPSFDESNIISDFDLTNSNSMNEQDIQFFLDKLGSLGEKNFLDLDGSLKKASDIIYKYSKEFDISPQYILVTLQKEQSLIESKNIEQKQLDWAMGYAVCDDCSKDDPRIQKYKGFVKQIYYATKRNRYYIDNPLSFAMQVGRPHLIDGIYVIPKNQATVSLYIYTPHLHGNENFHYIWNSYFTKFYPDGTILQAYGEDGVWLIQNAKRRPFLTATSFFSRYNSDVIINVSKFDIEKYDIGSPIKYSNYSLLKNEKGAIYLLDDDTIRQISSWDVFMEIGFSPYEIIDVLNSELLEYKIGNFVNERSIYPTGAVLKDISNNKIYYVQDGMKHEIITMEIYNYSKTNYPIFEKESSDIKIYKKGVNLKLPDGFLVKSDLNTRIYVISNGEKREIKSKEVFETLGYKWENVKVVSEETLSAHSLGFPIENIY